MDNSEKLLDFGKLRGIIEAIEGVRWMPQELKTRVTTACESLITEEDICEF